MAGIGIGALRLPAPFAHLQPLGIRLVERYARVRSVSVQFCVNTAWCHGGDEKQLGWQTLLPSTSIHDDAVQLRRKVPPDKDTDDDGNTG